MPHRDLLETMLERQEVLADFADLALQSEDLDEVLQEACRLVAKAMGTERAKVLEMEAGDESLLVRAGVGWAAGVVGHVRLPMDKHSSETFAINAGEPVITRDIAQEERFDVPRFMKDAGIVALVNVPIFLPRQRAYGLLQVDDTRPRDFDQHDSAFLRTYAGILGPIVDRLLKLRQLRSTEERFRLTVEAATDYAIFVTDAEDRITDWLPGAAAVFGWSAEEALGQSAAMLFTPEDRAAGVPERELETALREGSAPDVRWHLCKDGSRVFIEGTRRSLSKIAGNGFLKIGQDVTARRLTEERLSAGEERLRLLSELVPALLWQTDGSGDGMTFNARAQEYLGWSAEQQMQAGDWLDAVHPEDREAAERVFAEAFRSGRPLEHQHRLRGSDGQYRWFLVRQIPWHDDQGQLSQWFGAAIDINELRQFQMRQDVLVAELQHRTRNLIGVVRSIANQTMAHTGPSEAFREALDHRLEALSRVQGLLSRAEQEPITLRRILTLELDALGAEGKRVVLEGPSVRIRPSRVQTLALALHELATNARKYGALSQTGRQLSVTWTVRDSPTGRWLHIAWCEEGVTGAPTDQPSAPPEGGYGRVLIERALPYALGAEVTYALDPGGLRCTIELPLDPPDSLRSI
ncbi:PAS domain S-box protein [Paracoccus sp. S-4012]|uniref:PAS domain S-box protein n=1 Tax=Paracoccus sp. S-4012 TaxID=2665648 RepID=UPI0012AF81CD|nr:PAS domain S-box protein [Paracoccus sp. S-4012]MRX51340.1 PAS domain S-box protein [Paracoccus sp. S-4012]